MISSPRRRFWITLASTGATLILLAIGFWFGTRIIQNNAHALGEAQARVLAVGERQKAISSADDSLQTVLRERDAIRQSFVDPTSPLPFIEMVERAGREEGLRPTIALTQSALGAAGKEYFITTEGSFTSVLSFLRRLETLPFISRVTSTELRTESDVSAVGASGLIVLHAVIELVPKP
jgi:hypothetical protein